jgi:hypothetical protein
VFCKVVHGEFEVCLVQKYRGICVCFVKNFEGEFEVCLLSKCRWNLNCVC